MKKVFAFVFVLLFGISVQSQNLITLQHGSTASFFTDLQTSIIASTDGDYIYIPGGTWGLQSQTILINKRLNIYGAGALSDSTMATGITQINPKFHFISGANNCFISGCKFLSAIYVGADSCANYIDNLTFQFNYITQIGIYSKARSTCLLNNVINNNCNIYASSNFNVSNNIIYNTLYVDGNQASNGPPGNSYGTISNCYLNGLTFYSYSGNYVKNLIVKNNFIANFTCCFTSNSINYSLFKNNFSLATLSQGQYGATNDYSNNQVVANVSIIFTNINNTGTYVNSNNYHIVNTSNAHNAGEDGTDIGIYGGTNPWKEGALPNNPHIRFSNINSSTGAGGNLPVNIKVAAQDR
ncbi:MAG: hypothetical protein IPP32_12555 [Bacteroidetes bacterium]|nr:hypothetical protein [Bacteroidota bacterium]